MIKLTALECRQTRSRKPYLIGRLGPYWLTVIMTGRQNGIGATLWIAPAEPAEPLREDDG